MELRQLEYFRAIVDAGTISGAARVLHMTQPPLSYQIKMLEEELQVPLLIRGTKKITLTEAGKTLYEQAGTLLMFADLTRREVVKSSQSATLHIGMTPSTVSLLADYLLRISNEYVINFYCPFGPPPLILSLACDTILILSQEALFCYPHHFRLLYSPQHSWGIRLFI